MLCILSFNNWKINTLSSKNVDRTKGDKKQIFPTLELFHKSEVKTVEQIKNLTGLAPQNEYWINL